MPLIAVFREKGSAGTDVRIKATLTPRNAAPVQRVFNIPVVKAVAGQRVQATSEIVPDSVTGLPEGLEVVLVYEPITTGR